MEHIRLSLSQFFSTCYLSETWGSTATKIIILNSRLTLWGSTSNYSVPDLGVPLGIFDHIYINIYIWGLDVWAINLADTSRYKICIYIYHISIKSPLQLGLSRFQMATWKSWSIKRPHQVTCCDRSEDSRSTALLYINEMEHMPQSHLFGRPSLFRARIGCWGNNPNLEKWYWKKMSSRIWGKKSAVKTHGNLHTWMVLPGFPIEFRWTQSMDPSNQQLWKTPHLKSASENPRKNTVAGSVMFIYSHTQPVRTGLFWLAKKRVQ